MVDKNGAELLRRAYFGERVTEAVGRLKMNLGPVPPLEQGPALGETCGLWEARLWRSLTARKRVRREELARWRAIPEDYQCSHDRQLAELLDSMAAGERPAVSGPDVRRTIEFMASLYKSAITGEPVRRV